jgi:hypothetical protein
MSDNLEAWKTQKESKHAVHYHAESPFGGEIGADRKELAEHRMSDSLSEKARRDLVQAKMVTLAQSIIDRGEGVLYSHVVATQSYTRRKSRLVETVA